MEGLIPIVYRAIIQYRNGKEAGPLGSWFNESPSASYMRLPGDSGRFSKSDIPVFGSDYGFSTSSTSSSNMMNSSTTQIIVSTGTQSSPLNCRLTSRRVAT